MEGHDRLRLQQTRQLKKNKKLSYSVRHPASNEVSGYFAYLLFLCSTVLRLVHYTWSDTMLDRPDSFPESLNGGPPHSEKSE